MVLGQLMVCKDDKAKKDDKKKILPRGKDSNEAVETFQESYEQGDDDGLDENDDPEEEEIILPPKDGSLKVIFSTHCMTYFNILIFLSLFSKCLI